MRTDRSGAVRRICQGASAARHRKHRGGAGRLRQRKQRCGGCVEAGLPQLYRRAERRQLPQIRACGRRRRRRSRAVLPRSHKGCGNEGLHLRQRRGHRAAARSGLQLYTLSNGVFTQTESGKANEHTVGSYSYQWNGADVTKDQYEDNKKSYTDRAVTPEAFEESDILDQIDEF